MRRWLLGLVFVLGCTGQDVHLKGKAGEVFRKITGAGAMTLSEKEVAYGTKNPPSALLVCHETEGHQAQAKVIGDALSKLGMIDDDELSRALAWIAIYSIAYLNYGYENQFELEARKKCRHLEPVPR